MILDFEKFFRFANFLKFFNSNIWGNTVIFCNDYVYYRFNFNIYNGSGRKGPWGVKDQSPIFYLLELIKEVKIGISRNALLHWIEIFMKFSNLYKFFRFDQGKVCLCTFKRKCIWSIN